MIAIKQRLLVLILVLSLLTPTFVWAETGAGITPDSPFYFVDTLFEKVGSWFVFSDESKAKKALSRAEERLAEIKVLGTKEELKDTEVIDQTLIKYEEQLTEATEKAKALKQKEKSEEVLSLVLEKTLNHQEILNSVLQEVPEQAKSAVEKAIEVSSKGYDKALEELIVLRQEVENLKKEIEELKQQEQTSEKGEVAQLREEIEQLKKQLGGQKLQQPQLTPFKTQEVQQKISTPIPILKETPKEEQLTISYITPNRILNNIGAVDVTIVGTGFKKGVIVDIGVANKPLTTLINDKEINLRIPGSLIPGTYNLIIINPDGKRFTLNDAITIQAPPEIKSSGLSDSEIVNRVRPAVILTCSSNGSCGSGVIIESSGFILTNAHVVGRNQSMKVRLDNGRILDGVVVGRDEYKDLAVIKVSESGLTSVPFGDSSDSSLPLTSDVIAFGWPLAVGDITGIYALTVEQGDITARGTDPEIGEVLQTNALIHKGNSGGPLVNKKAEVIGINTFGIVSQGGIGTGVGFAVPSDTIKNSIPNLKAGYQNLKTSSTPVPTITPETTLVPTSTPSPTPTVPGTLSVSKAPDSPQSRAFYWGQNDATFTKVRFRSTNEGIFIERLTIATDDSVPDFTSNVDSVKINYKNKSGSTLTTIGSSNAQGNTSFGFTGDNRPYIPKDSSVDFTISANLKSKAARTGQAITQGIQFSANLTGGDSSLLRAIGESTGTVMDVAGISNILGNNHIVYRAFPEFIQESLTAGSPVGTKDVLKLTIKAHGLSDSSIIFDNDTFIKFEVFASGSQSAIDMTARLFDVITGEQYASTIVSNAQVSLVGNRTSINFGSWDKGIEIDGGAQKTLRVQVGFVNFTDKNDNFQIALKDRNAELAWKSSDIVQLLVPGFIRLLPMEGPIFVQP